MAVSLSTGVAEAVSGTTVTISMTGGAVTTTYTLMIVGPDEGTETTSFISDGAGAWSGSMVVESAGTYTLTVTPIDAVAGTATVVGH